MPKTAISAILAILLLPSIPAHIHAQGYCLEPPEPFLDKLSRSDPLYQAARDEAQRYFEEMEDYLRCLEHERADALARLKQNFGIFKQNFANDAVFRHSLSDDQNGDHRSQ